MKTFLCIMGFLLMQQQLVAQAPPLRVNWEKSVRVSRSTPTLQVVVNPMIREGSPIYEASFEALRNLHAEYVRFGAWYPYPRLSVAALEPPGEDTTSWDFSLLDPILFDFLKATQGHTSILNYCTIPQWMFKTPQPVPYPDDPELEHGTTPEQYTRRYDAIVNAIREVSPDTRFIGMAAVTYWNPEFYEYFLNPENHQAGTPLDMISYHFYAGADPEIGFENFQYSYFEKADAFLTSVRYIENIRKRLAPDVKTAINELGTFLSEKMRSQPIPDKYWNLSAAVYGYLFMVLSKLGIDIIGESQLVGYPGQFPDVSMMNWENGRPNAKYWALKLLIDHFAPGDTLVETTAGFMIASAYSAQAFLTKEGAKRVLLVNKRDKNLKISVPADFAGGELIIVDQVSGENEPRKLRIEFNRAGAFCGRGGGAAAGN